MFASCAVVERVAVLGACGACRRRSQGAAPAQDPVLVLETAKGTIEIRLFRIEAPKSVDHLLELMKRSFYRGQRFHRVDRIARAGRRSAVARHVAQGLLGQRQHRKSDRRVRADRRSDRTCAAPWLAHCGNPLGADSQFYIMKTAEPGPRRQARHHRPGRRRHGGRGQDRRDGHDQERDGEARKLAATEA